jgi:predicted ATPase/DNA-binding CsgD family transcriptional regulator
MTFTNLPVQLTTFIGRERELAEVQRLLTTNRLITLTGAGGSGKTRLAIQIANRISDAFADGAWLVELASVRDPALVAQHVVHTFGLRPVTDQPLMESLIGFVRSKQLLLILDNCEHLNEACAQLTRRLLTEAPELHVLATSREPLAIAGETVYPLSGLAWPVFPIEIVPDGQNRLDLEEMMRYDAVRLFVERAHTISPHFTITPENVSAIIEICQRLDGMPLALELASARVNVLTIQEIAVRLDDRFALLTSGQRQGLEPRHYTLRLAMDWSYALLIAEEQTMLRRLAVFAAGCTLDSAVAICAGDGLEAGSTLDLLSSLVDKSLVLAETTGRGQARYRLLETIREYAREELDRSGESSQLHDRHLGYFLTRSEEAAPKLGDSYQQLWLNWLDGEQDNLRAALSWALEAGSIEEGLRLATALVRYWEIRSLQREARSWLERLLDRADEKISPSVRVNASTWASFLALFQGDASASVRYGRDAVNIAESAGSEFNALHAFALAGLAMSARGVGDFQTAFITGEQALQYYRESGSSFHLGMGLLSNGDSAIELGEYATAHALLDESLALAVEAGDNFRIGITYNALGDLARYEEKNAEALAAYQKGEALLRKLDAQHHLASVLVNLGRTCLRLGKVEQARRFFNESLAIYQAEQDRPGQIECLIGFASVAVKAGQHNAGVRLLAAAATMSGLTSTAKWRAKRLEFDRYLELARHRLTEADFQAEQAVGRSLTLEQALETAWQLQGVSGTEPPLKEKLGELTEREGEVAALVAQGKINREIAHELVLSTRTVEKHVANILSKLGLHSRTQIVRWVMEHDLK